MSTLPGSISSSPVKRRHEAITSVSSSPTPPKRPRTAATTISELENTSKVYIFTDTNPNVDEAADDNVITMSNTDTLEEAGLDSSFSKMDSQSHNRRVSIREAMKVGKGTGIAYPRHVKNYHDFMVSDQLRRKADDPTWTIVPPFPITARNVAVFLDMETTRMQKNSDGQWKPGTRLGVSAIKQCISALESWRLTHEHEYKDNPDAIRPLRQDSRIRTYEANAGATEAERNAEAQITKALGITSDTYTQEELTRAAVWCLQAKGSNQQVHLALRDRAMMLMSTSTAFRGDNIRSLLLSDLFSQDIRLIEAGLDKTAMAVVCLTDHGKTNTNGRVDEQAAFRHRHPEICSVGALAFYLFSLYHIMQRKRPTFAPDFSSGGEFGFRSWYKMILFPGSGGDTTEMTYENHRKRVNTIYAKNDIVIRKSTHAGRPYAATTTREHGSSAEGTKALGLWQQGPVRAIYDHAPPVDAMLASANFLARKQETYFISRDVPVPPLAITSKIFPWIEEEEAAYKSRFEEHGRKGSDIALREFLSLLRHLRPIIVQDAAVLKAKYPECPLFEYFPFNTVEFTSFCASAIKCIAEAEADAARHCQNLPELMVESLRGIVESGNIKHERLRDEMRQDYAQLTSMIANQSQSQPKGKRRGKTSQTTVVSPASSSTCNVSQLMPPPPPPLTPLPLAVPGVSLPASALKLKTIISTSGQEYPFTTFPLSQNDFEREKQLTAISELEGLFPVERLGRHQFEWIKGLTENQQDEWLPIYAYWRPADKLTSASMRQIWDEWTSGVNGQLSVMQLTSKWNARWRRNNSAAKTEASRRKKVTTLIETLRDQHNWSVDRVLEFLESTYPIPTSSTTHLKSTRAFIDYLQKKDGGLYQEILEKAKQEAES